MDYHQLGRSGLLVSPLCFGVLTIGPLQAGLPLEQGADLLRAAMELGVNFFDTAEYYQTYPYLYRVLAGREEMVVATKSYAATGEDMRASIEKARVGLGLDRIPIFLLHEQSSLASFRGHRGAWEALVEARERGLVGAIGLSTHTVEGVRVAFSCPELDVVHPLFNQAGWGLHDGSAEEMADAIKTAGEMGKGVYAMKALAGGHLRHTASAALQYVLGSPGVVSVAVGMQSIEELRFNLAVIRGGIPAAADTAWLATKPRRLHVESWCQGCGRCVERCSFGALKLVGSRVVVDPERCLTCGYCSQVCPEVALKII